MGLVVWLGLELACAILIRGKRRLVCYQWLHGSESFFHGNKMISHDWTEHCAQPYRLANTTCTHVAV